MKITKIKPSYYFVPYDRPLGNGKYMYYGMTMNVCCVETDEGITGVGYVGGPMGGGGIIHETLKELSSYVVGEDPFTVEKIWAKMYLPKIFGRKGLEMRAISAVDIAIWDLIGKAVNQPLYKLLGGYTNKLKAYVAAGYYEKGLNLKMLSTEMEQIVNRGARAVKMKIGRFPIREDAERIRVARETIGPDVDLLVDANNAYSVPDAIKMARHLEKYDVYWFEEPVNCDDIPGQAAVTAATDIPVAIGENEYTRWGFRDLVDNKCANIFNTDCMVVGGITEWKRVADLAAAHDIPIAPHGNQFLHVHLTSAVPNGLILEWLEHDMGYSEMFIDELPMVDGYVSPPERPGLGFEFNFKAMEKYLKASA